MCASLRGLAADVAPGVAWLLSLLQLIIEQQQQELEQLRLECGGSTGAKKRPSKETVGHS